MTRSKHTAVIVFVLAWAAVVYGNLVWLMQLGERQTADRTAAIEAQQRQIITATYEAPVETDEDKPPYLGEYTITVYTPECDGGRWGYATATGTTSEHLATCAVDPSVIPLGSVIYAGDLMLVAVDIGSAVRGNVIDVFYDGTKAEALAWLSCFGDQAQVWLCTINQ